MPSTDFDHKMVELDGRRARYVYSRVDLNGDGADEVLVYLYGSIFCGTGGCNLLVLTPANGGDSALQTFPITRLPVIVSPHTSEGTRILTGDFTFESGAPLEPRS